MRLAALWRYPVKSLRGERLESAAASPAGIPGDRAWALVSRSDGRPLSAKRVAALLLCRARFVDEPRPGRRPPPAEIELPDGSRLRTDDAASAGPLSRVLGVECALAAADDGAGCFDAQPLHVLTTSTLSALAAAGAPAEVERFRPNLLLDGAAPGRPEDAWPGSPLSVGEVVVDVLKPVKRCVMTTLPQGALPAAPSVLRAIAAAGGALGVYGRARGAGAWRAGDPCAIMRPQ